MATYVALIRGIGPGDPQKTNKKLCEAMEQMGCMRPTSVISSGNIIFESDEQDTGKLEARIEAGWPELLGFRATTIVKSQRQLQELIDSDLFEGAVHSEGSYLLVTFCKHAPKLAFTLPFQPEGKPYVVVEQYGDALCTITNNTVVKTTDLMTWLERQFGKELTSRTPLTVQRILKKMDMMQR